MRRAFRVIQRIEESILSVAVIAMAGVTIANVFARNLFDSNVAAAEELNQFLIVIVCFVGLSYAAGRGRHIRMTALYDQLAPRVRKGVAILVHAATASLMLILAWNAYEYVSSVERVSPVLGVPLRSVYLICPLGLALCGIQYLLALLQNLVAPGVFVAFDRTDEYVESAEREQ
jgi:TRAP-type C4-dicarboxylate transport system permease small subunit